MFVEFELSYGHRSLGAEYGVAPLERNLSCLDFYKHVAPSGARNGSIVHEEFSQNKRASLSRSAKQTHS